jgi:6-pyruvoyltetrahydropterin/6-carboxytetrahydropterin synthase
MPSSLPQPVWELEKDFTFEASHKLLHHDGKCHRLHGHSWKGSVKLVGYSLEDAGPKQGMVFDYSDIASVLRPMVEDYLDHHHLNDTLEEDTPTSEFVARWVFHHLKGRLPGLFSVRIEETCTSRCTFRE